MNLDEIQMLAMAAASAAQAAQVRLAFNII